MTYRELIENAEREVRADYTAAEDSGDWTAMAEAARAASALRTVRERLSWDVTS